MPKTFVTIGKTSTHSVDAGQPVWVLLPGTVHSAVVSTYSRQLYSGLKALVRLGSVRNIFNAHLVPQLNSIGDRSLEAKKHEIVTLRGHVDAVAGDVLKRAQIFLSFLSAKRLIDRTLDPILEKIQQKSALTGKDVTPLVNALYATLRKNADATSSQKQKIRDYIQTGTYDTATILWLALFVDPVFALHLWHDSLVAELQDSEGRDQFQNKATLERDLRRAVEQIRAGGACADEVCGIDLRGWLTDMIGCDPQSRFFAEIGESQQGLNKKGCLSFDQSKSFHDFGETASRFVSLDKLSRVVTAFDRTLSHMVIAFANDDAEMKQLCHDHAVHSGLLIRGLLGESEAIKTLYPSHAMAIPNQPELGDILIAKIRTAYENGSLAQVCAPRYGMSAEELGKGIAKAVAIQRQVLPLVPMEVHRLADAIETRIRLRKIAERLTSSGDQHQAVSLDLAFRAQTMRQSQLNKTLKADFRIDPARLFFLDDLLIDRMKSLFGNELEFMRTVLAPYLERNKIARQSQSQTANSGSAINS
jgi:hypothetical protein